MKRKLLIIEDEPAILKFLHSSLEEDDWRLIETSSGIAGVELAAKEKPDIILLDLGLPDRDGLTVLKDLRRWTSVPIIIISARGQEKDKIIGLDAGADDYLTKPFGVEELKARLRVALRHAERVKGDADPTYENAGLKVDLIAHKVWLKSKEVRLTPLQFNVLAVLVRNAGHVVSQKQLIQEAWGDDATATSESVRIFVHQLRQKIEPEPARPKCLKTEPGVGYRLELPA